MKKSCQNVGFLRVVKSHHLKIQILKLPPKQKQAHVTCEHTKTRKHGNTENKIDNG